MLKTVLGVLASLSGSLAVHGLAALLPEYGCSHATTVGAPTVGAGEFDVEGIDEGSVAPPSPPAPAPVPVPATKPPPPKPKEPPPPPQDVDPTLPGLPPPPPEPEAEAAVPSVPETAAPAPGDPNALSAQRGRIGEAAECTDPVAGTWRSSLYDGQRRQWYVFTLTVHRAGAVLSGTIQSKFWQGPRSQPRAPTSCAETRLWAVVSMPARGVLGDDNRVRFGSSSFTVEHLHCGDHIDYTPDRFSGTLNPAKNEFQSIVTDGANLIDQPLLLRRIACEGD
jgi:hypothetical protein